MIYFRDSFGEVFAYDYNGKLEWNKKLKAHNEGGMAVVGKDGAVTYSSISGNRN